MTPVLRTVDRWLLAPAPPARLATLRVLVGGYCLGFLVVRFPGFLSAARLPERQFEPVGVLAWMPASVAPAVFVVVAVVTLAAGVAFVAGRWWRVSGPAFALLFLAATTYRFSWGHVLHTENLASLHLLVIGFTAAAACRGHAPHARFGWPVRVLALLTVTTYVVAGVAKVRNGGWDWLVGDVLRNQVAFDNLRKELLGDLHSPLGGWLVGYAWVFVPLALLTVAVELAAPVALAGGRMRTVWVALAWGFHVGITALMAIVFPYHLLGIAYAPFFRCERLTQRWPTPAAARRVTQPEPGLVSG
jgi:hypothetical protein